MRLWVPVLVALVAAVAVLPEASASTASAACLPSNAVCADVQSRPGGTCAVVSNDPPVTGTWGKITSCIPHGA